MRIRTIHFRWIRVGEGGKDRVLMPMTLIRELGLTDLLQSRGGWTRVIVDTDEGETFEAFARCSEKDNYCKRFGRDLALDRAYARLILKRWSERESLFPLEVTN